MKDKTIDTLEDLAKRYVKHAAVEKYGYEARYALNIFQGHATPEAVLELIAEIKRLKDKKEEDGS